MEDISTDGNQRKAEGYIWCRNKLDGNQLVFIAAFNTTICVTAILVNTLTLIALGFHLELYTHLRNYCLSA